MFKYQEAAAVLEEYNKIDKADRYIVNKTSKYLMRNGAIQRADTLFKSFVFRHEKLEKTIHTLQKFWYELAMGNALCKQRKWKRGLRMFGFFEENLNVITEDQSDFYNFALRKFSIIQFIDMVRFNTSSIRQDKRFIKGLTNFLRNSVIY